MHNYISAYCVSNDFSNLAYNVTAVIANRFASTLKLKTMKKKIYSVHCIIALIVMDSLIIFDGERKRM